MIAWVYYQARQSTALDRLLVATDSDQILSYCRANRLPALMTSRDHASGTDRLVEVMDRDSNLGQAADIYVNIQGDEPMVTAAHIDLLIEPFVGIVPAPADAPAAAAAGEADSGVGPAPPVQVSTLKVAINREAAQDPNAVKVVTDLRGFALYFSRAAVPYSRDGFNRARYYKHLGFYAYTAAALGRFRSLMPSPLEQTECLEQLRFLENGVPIAVLETADDTIGVDTEEDLQRVEEYFQRRGLDTGLHR